MTDDKLAEMLALLANVTDALQARVKYVEEAREVELAVYKHRCLQVVKADDAANTEIEKLRARLREKSNETETDR